MADARRKKLMGGKEAPLVEILLRPSPNNDEWRQSEIQKMEEAKLTECSFKPQTLDYPIANQGSGDKNMDLYQKIKKRQYADKKSVATDEYEYMKAPEEYKFAPNIN